MLNFGNKEFRNLQEQVLENMNQIDILKQGTVVLDEFGIKVIGQLDSADDLPESASEFGDAYAVGTEPPYNMYIWTRTDETGEEGEWFNIGMFPVPGPQGPAGRSIVSVEKTYSDGNVDTYTITYSDNTYSYFYVTNGANGEAGAQGHRRR